MLIFHSFTISQMTVETKEGRIRTYTTANDDTFRTFASHNTCTSTNSCNTFITAARKTVPRGCMLKLQEITQIDTIRYDNTQRMPSAGQPAQWMPTVQGGRGFVEQVQF